MIRAEKALAAAQENLAALSDGPRAELPQQRLALARANLDKAIADLDKLTSPTPAAAQEKRGLALFAESELQRAEADLAKLSAPDAAAADNARAAIAVAEANLGAAEKALADLDARRELEVTLKQTALTSAQAQVNGAESRLADSTLEAPADGYVSRILVKEREEVDAAKPVMEVIDFAVVEVKGRVDEIDVLSLERGMATAITLDSLPDRTLQGVVANISSDATNEQGIVTFAVEVSVTIPDDLRLQEGLSASAKAALGEERGLLVPNQAIRGDYDNPTVFVVVGEGVEERPVTLGGTDRYQTVILEGLSEGERVQYEVEAGPSAFQVSAGFGPPPEYDEDP